MTMAVPSARRVMPLSNCSMVYLVSILFYSFFKGC
jgi:hypothetical protein